ALRDGIKLGHQGALLWEIAPAVVERMKRPYPNLEERLPLIRRTIRAEEEGFLATLDRGEEILKSKISGQHLSGEDAFLLYDSYGFHIELIEDLCHEHGAMVDRKRFEELLKAKKERERGDFAADIFGTGPFATIKEEKEPLTEFLGYQIPIAKMHEPVEARVRRIVKLPADTLKAYEGSKKDLPAFTRLLNSGTLVQETTGDVAILLDRTPFYGESGGQVGDAGRIDDVEIYDCKRPDGYFWHLGRGAIRAGATVKVRIDAARRLDIMRNHTGTHVLQAALRAVLGQTVQQAGSGVDPDRLRFDFTWPQALTRDEVRKVEDWCNAVILADLPVTKEEMSMEEAKRRGAIAFFGEKYGERVRVVTIGESKSIELCGGTHLEHTATIGQVKIVSESSIQRGVRRIEAVTGLAAIESARKQEDTLMKLAAAFKCAPHEILERQMRLAARQQVAEEMLAKLKKAGAASVEIAGSEIHGERIAAENLPDKKVEELRDLMDTLIKKQKFAAAILASGGEKPAFVIGVREDLVARGLKAGDLAKEVGKACGGGGGGRELQAQAGAADASKVPLGLAKFEELVRAKLG
ncbi:MAG: hypothetical protein HYY17_08150, partial [Planctomycetes bacterium]|nr:hypothetical protein [Planctomycetota bacterium]